MQDSSKGETGRVWREEIKSCLINFFPWASQHQPGSFNVLEKAILTAKQNIKIWTWAELCTQHHRRKENSSTLTFFGELIRDIQEEFPL